MPSDDQILVTCTNGECPVRIRVPLLDLQTFILIHTAYEIPSYDEAQASKPTVPCPACEAEERDGTLVYLDDHLRKAPPDKESFVPALLEAGAAEADGLWKRAEQIGTVVGDVADWVPGDLAVPTGVALEVRPYGGFMLRHGNNDDEPQYADEAPGLPSPTPRHIRELKHDLWYMAYYGDREKRGHKTTGGAGVFEAMTVGALLALKFDLSFFYGVPTTADLAAATISDDQYRRITFATFSGPIYFDMAAIGDNPIEPIYANLIRPLADQLGSIGVAQLRLKEALDAYDESAAPELGTKQGDALRKKALDGLGAATKSMGKKPPKPVTLPDLATITAVRKVRSVDEVLGHPHFDQTQRKPWDKFAEQVRAVAALEPLRKTTLRPRIEALIAAESGKSKLADSAKEALTRYDRYIAIASSLDASTVDDIAQIVGGLPETFEPYLVALRAQSVVDHGTAIYIKAVMAGLKIGSSSGKISHKGRKLVYRAVPGGIVGEPESMDAFADLVIEACKESGKFTMPPFIMLERMKNESGFRATSKIGELGLTKAEKKASTPQTGIDWSNWGGSKFFFSELFTKSVARKQALPGYMGPVVHSRGVGAGQVTLPTLVKGVSDKGRSSKAYELEWVSGIPASADNETVSVPAHWNGARGSIENASKLLQNKFGSKSSKERECTFDKVEGGTKYDCCRCLARFDLRDDGDIAHNKSGGASRSFHCKVDASRWPELFGQALADDDEKHRTEFPCSWLRAVQLYAGSGDKSFKRILKCTRELVKLTDPTMEDADKEKVRVLRAALERARSQL